jgi:hypothetical protein
VKKLVALVFAALLTALSFSATNAATPTQINAAMEQSVELHGNLVGSSSMDVEGEGDIDYCSGSVLKVSGSFITIATARHCVTRIIEQSMFGSVIIDVQPLYVVFADGSHGLIMPGTVLAAAKDDVGYLTVLKTDNHVYHPVSPSFRNVTRGQKLFLIGDAEAQGWVYSEGYFTRAGDAPRPGVVDNLSGEQSSYTFICTACGPGDSGGGVFDNATGQYLGLMTAGGMDMDFLIPANVVVRDYPTAKIVTVPDLTMFLNTPAPSPSPSPTSGDSSTP